MKKRSTQSWKNKISKMVTGTMVNRLIYETETVNMLRKVERF